MTLQGHLDSPCIYCVNLIQTIQVEDGLLERDNGHFVERMTLVQPMTKQEAQMRVGMV